VLETSARLLRLLTLLQAHREWSGTDLADRLDVTPRTVRRDVDKLRSLGYPVHASPGTAGGYRLGAGGALPPLLLSDEEAVAVAVGLRAAAGGTVTGIEETSVRALVKLEQVLPPRLRRQVNALHTVTVSLAHPGFTVHPETLTAIAAACRDHECLRFAYRSHQDEASTRTVQPHRLIHTGRRWYLLAWDTERADWRTFRVDRLTLRPPAGPQFVPREPPEPDLAAYTSLGISTRAYRYQARITLNAPLAAMADHIAPTSGTLQAIDDHTCQLRTGSHSLDELAIHLAVLGVDFHIHEPTELIHHVRTLADRLHRSTT